MYGATAGEVGILRFKAATNQAICGILPNSTVLPEFLFYFLLSKKEELVAQATGNAQPNISQLKIRNTEIPIPPVAEQKRIVQILDQAFKALQTAEEKIGRNRQNIGKLYQRSLAMAFEAPKSISEIAALETLCAEFADSPHRTPEYQAEGIPALRPRDVANGKLRLAQAALVSVTEYEIQSKRHKPRSGDIVYSRELTYGWAAKLGDSQVVCLSQGMCVFRPVESVLADYLVLVLNGPIGRRQATAKAVGTAHPHINIADIKSYQIPIMSCSRQKALVERFKALEEQCGRLNDIYEIKSQELRSLRRSLLRSAFIGRL
jgi:type I restriction enzyme S subunit